MTSVSIAISGYEVHPSGVTHLEVMYPNSFHVFCIVGVVGFICSIITTSMSCIEWFGKLKCVDTGFRICLCVTSALWLFILSLRTESEFNE